MNSPQWLAFAFWFLVSGFAVGADDQEGSSKQSTGRKTKTVFLDDFSGNVLDRSKWNVEVSGVVFNDELQAYVDSNKTVYLARGDDAEGATDGNALAIHPRFAAMTKSTEGIAYDFISGRLNTKGKADFTYGSISARIKMPEAPGIWPAFWALGNGQWPLTGEIDIMEYVGEKDWTGVALHGPDYSGETPLVNKFFFPPTTDATDWHVYSVEWSKDAIIFKIDARVTYRVTRPMVEHYGEWVFDLPKHLLLNVAVGGGYPAKTNGVRAPYLGLPEDTANQIKAGKLRMLVDWVKVTKDE